MINQVRIKRELEQQLRLVHRRLEILDMIEERLLKMKILVEQVLENTYLQSEIDAISDEIKQLEGQVKLLGMETTLEES